jgi:hypothetical protein
MGVAGEAVYLRENSLSIIERRKTALAKNPLDTQTRRGV